MRIAITSSQNVKLQSPSQIHLSINPSDNPPTDRDPKNRVIALNRVRFIIKKLNLNGNNFSKKNFFFCLFIVNANYLDDNFISNKTFAKKRPQFLLLIITLFSLCHFIRFLREYSTYMS